MPTPEKYAHINFKPPQGAREEAEKSLAWRREFGRGGTAVGIARARDLANGVELSPSTVRRMKAFFDRHQKNKSAPGWSPDEDGFPSNARIAWAMWGSDAGWSWAKKVVEQMNAADEKEKNERGLRPYGSTHGMRPKVYVVHGAPCSGKKDYVAKHLGENDVVFDYDEVMAAISGRPVYQPNRNLVSYCLDIRTLILKKALSKSGADKTWIIATKVGDDMKSQLSDVPVKYVHIDTPKEECLQRLEQDEKRQPLAEELRQVIEEYFSVEQRRAPLAQPGVERRYIGNFGSTERLDPELLRVEKRSDPETGAPRTYIVGYAARFHRDSLLLGDFVEQIDPGAFEIVTNRQDEDGKPLETRCLFNHDPNHLLGRFPTTMRMSVDEKGLKYECLLPETRSDLEELIRRGDLKGSSFSFVVSEGGERWTTVEGQSRRIVTKIKAILDCGPVTYPAYSDASVSVAKRSYEQFVGKPQQNPRRKSRIKALERRAETLRARIATEAFLAERRDCGRDEDGKFGSGNECQKKGEGTAKAKGKGAAKAKKTANGFRLPTVMKPSPSVAKAAKEAKDDYDASRRPWATGAGIGVAIGSALGLPGMIAGGVVGAALGAVSSAVMSSRMSGLKEKMKLTDESLAKASDSIFGKGKKTYMAAVDKKTIAIERGDGIALISNTSAGTSFYYQPGADKDGKFDLKSVEKAAKSVNAVSVTVKSWHGSDDKLLESKGYRRVPDASEGVYQKRLKTSKRSIGRLAERRDCGRDEDGRFGSGNECQEGSGDNKSTGGGKKSPSNYDRLTSSPKKSSFAGKEATDFSAASSKSKKSGGDYKAKDSGGSDFLGRKPSEGEDFLGRKPKKSGDEPTKVSGDGKKKPPYMEWKKGDHKSEAKKKKAQDFADTARTRQEESTKGKATSAGDDGSGVQTWSKGDTYPWTAKQVGDDRFGGYVQGTHPDGTKTKKYKFPAGSDAKDAHRQVEEEIKTQKKKRGERSISATASELRAFLEARR